jgi:hypothetical protein
MSTYKKVHRFLTFGLANNIIPKTNTAGENLRIITTALAEIPWQLPILYMNHSEFNLLPPGSHCTEVRVSVIHRGSRIAFEVASSNTGLATLNQVQNVITAEGINKTGYGANFNPTAFSVSMEPMIPTDVDTPNNSYSMYAQSWYGLQQTDAGFTGLNTGPHQMGNWAVLRNYFYLITTNDTPHDNTMGTPAIQKNIKFYDGKTTIDQPIMSCKYNPQMGLLKQSLRHYRYGVPILQDGNALNVPVNQNFSAGNVVTLDRVGTDTTIATEQFPANTESTNESVFSILSLLEKSQLYKQGAWGQSQKVQVQPSIHVGIQAIPSLSTAQLNEFEIESFTDCQASFEVVCEMDVTEYNPTEFPHATEANVPFGKQIFRQSGPSVTDFACTIGGLLPTNDISLT